MKFDWALVLSWGCATVFIGAVLGAFGFAAVLISRLGDLMP